MTIISKIAGVASVASCLHDVHKTALIYSNNSYAKVSADNMISNSIGNQKADRISFKDAQRKNWLAKNNFVASWNEGFAKIKGYVSGVMDAGVRYIPNFILSAIAIGCGKSKKIANIAAAALGLFEVFDFINNSTNANQRTDYLK